MRVKCIASDLFRYLEQESPVAGKVHSIFNEVINIITIKNELITLISHKKTMAPMCLQFDFSKLLTTRLVSGDLVLLSNSRLEMPRLKIKVVLEKMTIWHADMDVENLIYEKDAFLKNAEIVREQLVKHGEHSSLLPLLSVIDLIAGYTGKTTISDCPSNTYSDFIEDAFVALIKLLGHQNYEEASLLVPKIIGFGPGLTPSTDDFLMGFVMTTYYYERIDGRNIVPITQFAQTVFQVSQTRTTTVSEAMLKHASLGRIAESHRALIQGIYGLNCSCLQTLSTNVLNNGATSGTDFLFGMYCAQIMLLRRNI